MELYNIRMIKKHTIDIDSHSRVLESEYQATVARLAGLYAEVGQAHEEENDIFNALEDADIHCRVPRVHTSNIGYPSNEYSWLHYFFREAESQGYLKKSDYL